MFHAKRLIRYYTFCKQMLLSTRFISHMKDIFVIFQKEDKEFPTEINPCIFDCSLEECDDSPINVVQEDINVQA